MNLFIFICLSIQSTLCVIEFKYVFLYPLNILKLYKGHIMMRIKKKK